MSDGYGILENALVFVRESSPASACVRIPGLASAAPPRGTLRVKFSKTKKFRSLPERLSRPVQGQPRPDAVRRRRVEYPMYVGDPFNFAYYAQHFHRRPVAAGYVPDFPFPPLPSRDEFVYGTTPIDYVFSRARALGLADRLRFRNLAALTDVDRLRRDFSGWLLVVHRDVLQETLGLRIAANVLPPPMLELFLAARFGPPAFADARLAVWKIP